MTMFKIAIECDKVQKFWGDQMPKMAMEEAAEFIKALSKYERALAEHKSVLEKPEEEDPNVQMYMVKSTEDMVANAKHNLIDEIGDMWITLMAIQCRYEDGTWADAIDKRIEEKLSRKY